MNKAQLANKLYNYLNQNKIGNLTRDLQYQPRIATYKVTAEEILDFILKTLQEAILTGEKVNIPEIGIFRVVKKNARNARNPKTGEQVKVPAGKKLKLSVSRRMTLKMNGEYPTQGYDDIAKPKF